MIDSLIATSVDVERVFSHGRLLISHVCNRLTAQTCRAMICLREWGRLGLIDNDDLKVVTAMPEASGAEKNTDTSGDVLLPDDFDVI